MALSYGFTLGGETTSQQFSDAFHALFGDGVSMADTRFALTVNGMTVTLGSGYALAAGRWISSDELVNLTPRPGSNYNDRTDAIAIKVDYLSRQATIEILFDVDVDALRADTSAIRTNFEYSILLYLIRIRRGTTTLTPEDVTDIRTDTQLCGQIMPLSDVSASILYIYDFLTSGIDAEIARIIALSNELISKNDAEIEKINSLIKSTHAAPDIGELMLTCVQPSPALHWLLCNGSTISTRYAALRKVLGNKLPALSVATDRYRYYVYGGAPT